VALPNPYVAVVSDALGHRPGCPAEEVAELIVHCRGQAQPGDGIDDGLDVGVPDGLPGSDQLAAFSQQPDGLIDDGAAQLSAQLGRDGVPGEGFWPGQDMDVVLAGPTSQMAMTSAMSRV